MTDMREMTFRSPIFDRLVRMSSCIPSAKYAFAFSSFRFAKGNTAIDLSILRAETRGKRKKPAAAETTTPIAISIIKLRRRWVGSERRCRRSCANALWRDVVGPGENQCDGKSDQ